jgi:hypothetical protein
MPGQAACWKCGAPLPFVPGQPPVKAPIPVPQPTGQPPQQVQPPYGHYPYQPPPNYPQGGYAYPPKRRSWVWVGCCCLPIVLSIFAALIIWMVVLPRVIPVSPEKFLMVTLGSPPSQVEHVLGHPFQKKTGAYRPVLPGDSFALAVPTEKWIYNGGYVLFQNGLAVEAQPGPAPAMLPISEAERSNYPGIR